MVVSEEYPGKLVLYVGAGPVRYYYIAAKYPLMYAADVNEDGVWDLIYKDVNEDGVNGNETFYDSPSEMFTAKIAEF
jgi:hypothetical protein